MNMLFKWPNVGDGENATKVSNILLNKEERRADRKLSYIFANAYKMNVCF